MNTSLTAAAETFMRRMVRMDGRQGAGFHLRVRPGGCSGFSVEFDIVLERGTADFMWELAGLRIYFDKASRRILDGATVDYAAAGGHAGFAISSPAFESPNCTPTQQLVTIVPLKGASAG